MSSKRRLMTAGLTMAFMAGLGACGSESGSGSGQNDNPWEDSTASGGSSGQRDEGHDDDQSTAPDTAPEADGVTGLRDAVRHVSRKTAKVTRPHTVRKCTSPGRPFRRRGWTGRPPTWALTSRLPDLLALLGLHRRRRSARLRGSTRDQQDEGAGKSVRGRATASSSASG